VTKGWCIPFQFRKILVYLDFWGTWCGPCVAEITQHTQALKERFGDRKDIVFLYLAMDSDQDHQKWEQFIRLNTVTGFHLRKNNKAIESIWVDLLHTENVPRTYPTYAIFDRLGQLVTAEAKRPSDGEALYKQLSDALNHTENQKK
jgi:thiol-disulfide isomerase/thioredoxin